jgi:hypothetical protein
LTPENQHQIVHQIGLQVKPELKIGEHSHAGLNMEIFLGSISTSDSRLLLSGTEIDISDGYFFQKGDVYRKAVTNKDGQIIGEMTNFADGINVHGVFGPLIISGKFPSSHQLFLFS